MKKDLTEIVFILDRSGSMCGLEADTVGGFNSMLEKQKGVEGEALVSTVLFNHHTKVLHDRAKIGDVKPLTEKDYHVGGTTALLDAMGGAIRHIRNVHRYIREEDVPGRTLFVITTDGMENASHVYSGDRVRKMIGKMKEKYNWEFLFLGANIDAVETASRYGIDEDHAVEFFNDSDGVRLNYDVLSDRIRYMRCTADLDHDIDDGGAWKERIEEHRRRREEGK